MKIHPYIFAGINWEIQKFDTVYAVILSAIYNKSGVTREQIESRSRKREICSARHLCNYFLRVYTVASLKSIARVFGTDHSTVIHSICKVEQFIEMQDEEFTSLYKTINTELSTRNWKPKLNLTVKYNLIDKPKENEANAATVSARTKSQYIGNTAFRVLPKFGKVG